MYMIFRYNPGQYLNAKIRADLSRQLAQSQPNVRPPDLFRAHFSNPSAVKPA